MPITVKCECGKQASVRDELAGKAIKCPECGKPVKVPARPGSSAAPGKAKPAAAPIAGALDDLLAEEGMDREVASVCPSCKNEMTANAVLCTKCGYNRETGEHLEGHRVAGVDIDIGELALMKAEADIKSAVDLQQQLVGKAGMPPWMLALVLFLLGGATAIAVIAVNASRREEQIAFSPMRMFLQLGGSAFLLVGFGALLVLIGRAFMSSRNEGLLSLTIVYLFYFVYKNARATWKILATVIVCGAIAGAMFAGANNY